jgi:nucleoid-associated protein YgaU
MILIVKRWVAVAALSTVFATGAGAAWVATRALAPTPALAAPAAPSREPAVRSEPVPGRHFRFGTNDTLSAVSKRAYGTTKRVPDLLAANPGLDPERIRPGTVIYVPRTSERFTPPESPRPAPAPAASAASSAATPAASGVAKPR